MSSTPHNTLADSTLQESFPQDEQFKFISEFYSEDAFFVTRFKGSEAISEVYDFEITIVTKMRDSDSDLTEEEKLSTTIFSTQSLLISPAVFIIMHQDILKNPIEEERSIKSEDVSYPTLFEKIKGSFKNSQNTYFYGFPLSCTQGEKVGEWTFYTIHLRPALDKLQHITQSMIFTNKSVVDIVKNVLDRSPTISIDYTFENILTPFPKQNFSLQNNESSYAYLSAKLAHDGIYYFYSQDYILEQIIFMDDLQTHKENSSTLNVVYLPQVSANDAQEKNVITSFTEMISSVPRSVFLRDYNWLTPNAPVQAKAEISENGFGEMYLYGEGFETEEEGTRIANIRAEEILCQSYHYVGNSKITSLKAGYFIQVSNHYSQHLNKEYLITKVIHEGSQEAILSSIIGTNIVNFSKEHFYRNTFNALPASVQYRPKKNTERKTVNGFLTGFIASSLDDKEKVYTDEYGRYKVVFPQTALEGVAQAECMMRRAQASVGPQSGTLFPLYPGTEVIVGFSNAHPDRPVILSPISNIETGFLKDTGHGFSDVDNNEIVMNANGVTITCNGAGKVITVSKDELSNYDNSTNIVNGFHTGFSTLSTGLMSAYNAKLEVETNFKKLALANMAPVVTSVQQALSAGDASNHVMDSVGLSLEALGKLIPLALTLEGTYKDSKSTDCAYQVAVANEKEASKVELEADLGIGSYTTLLGAMIAHTIATIPSPLLRNLDNHSSMQKAQNAIDKEKKKWDEVSTEATATENKIKIYELKEKHGTLTDSEKIDLHSLRNIKSGYDTIKQAYDDKKYEKDALRAHTIVPAISEILTKAVAFFTLAYTKKRQNTRPRGGILLASDDNNVAISATSEARLVSGKQVFIGANRHLNKTTKKQLASMYTETDSPSWGTGNPCINPLLGHDERVAIVSKHILNGAEKVNRMISLEEISLDSAKKISLKNQSNCPVIQNTEPLIHLVGEGTPSPAIVKSDYPYAHIEMDNDRARNQGLLLSLKAHPNDHVVNQLNMYEDKTILQFQESATNKESTLTLDDKRVRLSYQTGASMEEKTQLLLANKTISLRTADMGIKLDSAKNETNILVDRNTFLRLNAKEGMGATGKNIVLQANETVAIKSKNFKVESTSPVRAQLSLSGGTAKINGKNIQLG